MARSLCLLAAVLLACNGSSQAAAVNPDGDAGEATEDGDSDGDGHLEQGDGGTDELPARTITFTASDATFLSPERGFYTTTNLATARDLGYVRGEGKTLVYAAVHLDAYLEGNHEGDLPPALFSDVQAGFDAVREAGIKAVVRFQYDDGEGYPGGANDAPEAAMTRHIEQLAPLLRDNEDVLFVLQAGFIGAWGEWHTSNNFEDGPNGKEPRARILNALLDALPTSRRVGLRYPAYKRMFYGESPSSVGDFASADARVGHVNDCFVSSDDDVGTYQYEPQDVLEAYLELDTRTVPIGGETCATHPRNACDVTLTEMARFHWTYVNDDYHPDVLARWESEGCRPEIEQRLGYRLRLTSTTLPAAVTIGDTFTVALALVNDGFAAPTNARPMRLVFEQGDVRHEVELDVDVRTLLPGESLVSQQLALPHDFKTGDADVRLWMPDPAPSLEARPEYALRLANEGLWNDARGDHELATVRLSESDSGDSDSGESDSGGSDSGESDSGESDSGESDSGDSDSGESDSGESDAGEEDESSDDVGGDDTGTDPPPPTTATVGGSTPEETGCACTTTSSRNAPALAALMWMGLIGSVLRRRRSSDKADV